MIKLFLTDIDGVLTDGGYYVPSTYYPCLPRGQVEFEKSFYMRKFNTRDFVGLEMLHRAGVQVAALTGSSEPSQIQFDRAAPFMSVYSDVQDKYAFIRSTFVEFRIHPFEWDEIAFIGDEINDAKLLEYVGMAACPADAVDEIQTIIAGKQDGYHLNTKGGECCVREFVDIIRTYQDIPATWGDWTARSTV